MTTKPLKKGATYDDLRDVPDHFVAEMFDGELYATPRRALPHTRAATMLGTELGGPFDRGRNGPGGWVILDEPELHFGNDVLVPDLAAWRRERLPRVPANAYLTLVPDWICEVLSASTEALDRGKKTTDLCPRRRRPCMAGRSAATHARSALARRARKVASARLARGPRPRARGAVRRNRARPRRALDLDASVPLPRQYPCARRASGVRVQLVLAQLLDERRSLEPDRFLTLSEISSAR